ncbi:MAG: c-type cytochrome [Ignavibacteria bacterium]
MKIKIVHVLFYFCSVLLVTSLMISCGKENKTTVTKENEKKDDTTKKTRTTNTGKGSAGRELFYMKSTSNNIACADCHGDGTNRNNPLTKYFSNLEGANKRTSTYHGMITGEEVISKAGGATICWEAYLRMKTPMTEEQIKDLNEYYASIASEVSPEVVTYETIALPVRDKTKLKDVQKAVMDLTGDPVKGEQSFNSSCGFCHGPNSTIKKVPSIMEDFEGNVKSIVYNVRLGDGGMPFFKNYPLSDQDVADIAAYIMKVNGK